MHRILVDEALPRSIAPRLRQAGIDTQDARDVGLRARPDAEVLAHAVSAGRALLTLDLDFGNLLRYPLGTHKGIIVLRFPSEVWPRVLSEAVLAALRGIPDADLAGNLVIVAPGNVRLRRAKGARESGL
jgi:predicted nuclease of predicted toxin-antitoxin system